MTRPTIIARIGGGVGDFSAAAWDACAGRDDPFLSHAFLSALEDSQSAVSGTGWQPVPIAIDGSDARPAALMPAYLKSHSLGEYVFDHGWADAFLRAGGDYYPKLQIAVPFTPVPGRRLLTRNAELAPALIEAAERLVATHGLSSAHATFIAPEQVAIFRDAGWLIRSDVQYHWFNRGFESFDEFLATLASRKRKAIRKERAIALDGLVVRHLTGDEIAESHWDAFWSFYQDTGARKWGRPYLSRSFFSMIGERMADRLLLVMAFDGDRAIAGALNLIGSDALYGRYWGALAERPFLHFELCYHQAIEAAISRGLSRVEAGAQGQHKIARGYEPVPTWSAHHIAHPSFREAVASFLERERQAVGDEIKALAEFTPFRKG